MAPERVHRLIAVNLAFVDEELVARGETVSLSDDDLYVSWMAKTASPGTLEIADGLVHVPESELLTRDPIGDKAPTDLGDGCYCWTEPPERDGSLMLAIRLPEGRTVYDAQPSPSEAKAVGQSVAVFWKFEQGEAIKLEWRLGELADDARGAAQRINREGFDRLLPDRPGQFRYDLAVSYAGEDREFVAEVVELLEEEGISVWYDQLNQADVWGEDLSEYLRRKYGQEARYTVAFISKHYVGKQWTKFEFNAARHILPARFDDSPLEGLGQRAYVPLDDREPAQLAALIVDKLSGQSIRP